MGNVMQQSNSIPFNFTYYAMKLLGKNLYASPWTAVSEIVANGIDAKAKFKVPKNMKKKYKKMLSAKTGFVKKTMKIK